MIGAAEVLADYWNEACATMRASFGVSLMDAGTRRLRWRELVALTRVALGDPATYLAAAVGGMKYPAAEIDTVQAAVMLGLAGVKENETRKVLPFGGKKKADKRANVSATEFADATRQMLAGLGIDGAEAEATISAALRS